MNTAKKVTLTRVGGELKVVAPKGFRWKLVPDQNVPVTKLPFWKTINLIKGLS